jgi:hypothetical protein
MLEHNLDSFFANEGKGYLFRTYVPDQTKQSLKTMVHKRYLLSTESALSWLDVRNTKQRVKDGLKAFFMKERGTFPPWLS